MYVYIIERDIIDLINGHKADILGIEFQNTGK